MAQTNAERQKAYRDRKAKAEARAREGWEPVKVLEAYGRNGRYVLRIEGRWVQVNEV